MKKIVSITGIIVCIILAMAGCQKQSAAIDETKSSDGQTKANRQSSEAQTETAAQSAEEQNGDDTQLSSERATELYQLSCEFTQYLEQQDTDAGMAMMDETMTAAMDGKLAATWEQLIAAMGAFVETGNYQGLIVDDFEVIEMELKFEKASIVQRIVFDKENRIAGLFFQNGRIESGEDEALLPDTIKEIDVTVDAGDGYPLPGKLTLPADQEPAAAVVLVHGSGPSDKDETIGPNKPFRDIAYALANQQIAVLRYDKRTYAHGGKLASDPEADKITIDEEAALDAVAAVKLLKEQAGINPDQVYLLGHSMGGGLLSYINEKGADCAGYIIMAGTSRNLWELSAEQNLLLADELAAAGEAEEAQSIRELVEQERQKAARLPLLTDEEAMDADNAVFGMSAWYLRKLDQINALQLYQSSTRPILVLQGEQDRQVTMKDFWLWQDQLKDHPDIKFIAYPQLNHLFGSYDGEAVPFSQLMEVEYAQRMPVADDVTEDIAAWILSR